MGCTMKRKPEVKAVNDVRDKGRKIRLLMDILEHKNVEIKHLKQKLSGMKGRPPQQAVQADADNIVTDSTGSKHCIDCGCTPHLCGCRTA